LGDSDAKILRAGGKTKLPGGTPMRLETINTLKSVPSPSVLIAIYSDQKMLDQVDAMVGLLGIVAVPHIPEALNRWEKTWSPIIHGAVTQNPPKLIDDPIVEQALVSLTTTINLSHSLLNPRDKQAADRTLRILRANGHAADPANLRAWATKNGWHPKAAKELEGLASKPWSLKSKPQLPDPDSAKGTYNYWCFKANEQS
jgi:hypothetical protein